MANNCLITKLKASVNNPNLPYYGELKLSFFKQSEIWVAGSTSISVKDLSGDFVIPAGESEVSGTSVTLTVGEEHTVLIKSKYEVTALQGIYTYNLLNITDINTMPKLIHIYARITGDLSNLKENDNILSFKTTQDGLEGDIVNFAKFPGITTLEISGCTGIHGTLESLFAAFPAAKTGTVTINANNCPDITFGGKSAGNATYTKSGNNWVKDV